MLTTKTKYLISRSNRKHIILVLDINLKELLCVHYFLNGFMPELGESLTFSP